MLRPLLMFLLGGIAGMFAIMLYLPDFPLFVIEFSGLTLINAAKYALAAVTGLFVFLVILSGE